jgi:hypothetical protein
MDHVGPLTSDGGFRYVLCIADRWSRWCHLVPTKTTTAEETSTAFLNSWIATFGPPSSIVCDGGPEFDNSVLRDVSRRLGCELHISTPSHAESHGLIERTNETLESVLRAFLKEEPSWTRLLPTTQFYMNSSPNRVTGVSPYRALFGFEAVSPVSDALGVNMAPMGEPCERAALFVSAELRERINAAQQKAHEKAARDFMRKAHGKTDFSPGDYVLVFDDARHKLDRKWSGPWLVDAKLTAVTYSVKSLVNGTVRRVHCNRLFPFEVGSLSAAQLHQQARRIDEYDLTAVIDHRYNKNGELELQVVWDGYDPYDADDERAWCPFEQCKGQDCVRAYMEEHSLEPSVAAKKTASRRGKRGGRGSR